MNGENCAFWFYIPWSFVLHNKYVHGKHTEMRDYRIKSFVSLTTPRQSVTQGDVLIALLPVLGIWVVGKAIDLFGPIHCATFTTAYDLLQSRKILQNLLTRLKFIRFYLVIRSCGFRYYFFFFEDLSKWKYISFHKSYDCSIKTNGS